jgi:hypothetical protein
VTEQADRIAQIVLAVPGVAALHAGMFGEVGTYLPGRRVAGVRVGADAIDVHVSLVFDAPVRATAAAIRRTLQALTALPVNVTVEDVVPAPHAERPPGLGGLP